MTISTTLTVGWQVTNVTGPSWKPWLHTSATYNQSSILYHLRHPQAAYPRNTWRHSPVLGFQRRTVASELPETIILPEPVNDPQVTPSSWPAKTCMHSPVVASHIQMVASPEPARMTLPFLCQVTHSTSCEGPSRLCTSLPVATSQILTTPS